MSIATEMKNLGEDIVTSYDMRIKAVGGLVKDTHKMLKGFQNEHKEMSNALRSDLAKGEQDRLKDFKAMMSDIKKFLADVTKSVSNMIKNFQKEHKAMSDQLKAGLANGETERLKDFKSMMANIQRAIKEIETYVANKLKEFDKAHANMSKELKKELNDYVMGIVKETQKLLKEYSSDMAQASKVWKDMSATMAKARRAGFMMPKIDAGQKVTTVKQAARKSQAKKKPAKKVANKKKSKSSRRKAHAGV